MGYIQQSSPPYKTFIKRGLVEALTAALAGYPDATVAAAKVAIDYTEDRFSLPAIIVKFYERSLPNAGVGHFEFLVSPQDPHPDDPTIFIEYQHRMYKGDIEFEIFGENSADRDVVTDALIEVLAMNEVTHQGKAFTHRLYQALNNTPYGLWHFPVLNLDLITGYGEQAVLAPWRPEDVLVYQTSYRVPIFGEFYSTTPILPSGSGLITEVDVYPWIPDIDPPPDDPSVDSDDYHKFTGWPAGETNI